MKYREVVPGIFIDRPNRFIANVWINKEKHEVHVKNTGRCREILIPGTKVFLEKARRHSKRRTEFSLISAWKGPQLINIDSQIPNDLVYSSLKRKIINIKEGISDLKREINYRDSRLDMFYRRSHKKGFIEVKGVTLEKKGVAFFPDAPTVRGTRHVLGLIDALKEGYEANIIFVIQMKGINYFSPNERMDPAFSKALRLAHVNGVHIKAYDCLVTSNAICIDRSIEVVL